MDLLKRNKVFRKFRGGKSGPMAPRAFSEFYPIENVHARVRKVIVKKVSASARWRNVLAPTERLIHIIHGRRARLATWC